MGEPPEMLRTFQVHGMERKEGVLRTIKDGIHTD